MNGSDLQNEKCRGCGHRLAEHFRDVQGFVRCLYRWDRGGPGEEQCQCVNYNIPKPEVPKSFQAVGETL